MLIVPKESPVIENLNSYYVNPQKLFEHYQGEIGSGAVHFNSPHAEGFVVFDKDDLLNGYFEEKELKMFGKAAIDRLIGSSDNYNYSINVYYISEEKIYFWASVPTAQIVYKELSTEFTDLEGLIRKMRSERLTGYIDVIIGQGKESGYVFFNNGDIIGGSYSWAESGVEDSKEHMDRLIAKTKRSGGIFNVGKISAQGQAGDVRSESQNAHVSPGVITMLEELLGVMERTVASSRATTTAFNTLLKKKFVGKAEKFAFLDPFAAEFEYVDHKIRFSGETSDRQLATGVIESVKELAAELGILPQFVDQLASWTQKYEEDLARFGFTF